MTETAVLESDNNKDFGEASLRAKRNVLNQLVHIAFEFQQWKRPVHAGALRVRPQEGFWMEMSSKGSLSKSTHRYLFDVRKF